MGDGAGRGAGHPGPCAGGGVLNAALRPRGKGPWARGRAAPADRGTRLSPVTVPREAGRSRGTGGAGTALFPRASPGSRADARRGEDVGKGVRGLVRLFAEGPTRRLGPAAVRVSAAPTGHTPSSVRLQPPPGRAGRPRPGRPRGGTASTFQSAPGPGCSQPSPRTLLCHGVGRGPRAGVPPTRHPVPWMGASGRHVAEETVVWKDTARAA